MRSSSRCVRGRPLLKPARPCAFKPLQCTAAFCSVSAPEKDAATIAATPDSVPHSIGGPEYFRALYKSSHEAAATASSQVQPAEKSPAATPVFNVPDLADLDNDDLSVLQDRLAPETKLDALSPAVDAEFLDEMGPALPKSFNLAVYANKSVTIRRLVQLGVDLSVCEKRGLGQELVTLDFEKDVEPLIRFLTSHGVPAERLGWWFTKNPHLFREPLENLQVRVDYLVSKRFSAEAVVRILGNAPTFLSFSVQRMDHRLGFLQRLLSLTGPELRHTVTRWPQLATSNLHAIQSNAFSIKEEMGFSKDELKQLIMVCPKLLVSSRANIVDAFTYLHQEAGLSHAQIVQFPAILRTRECIYKPRHQFLVHLGRAQFDPKEPNYVSLKALVTGTDAVFCENVAKTTVDKYNEFLKTL